MKVLAIMGNLRNGETLKAVKKFAENLSAMGQVEFNYIFLKDLNLKPCRGCFVCLQKGEELCPQREDDRDKIVNAMLEADGVIFATPNYSLQVTALMKNFLDRLCYVFHRPRFFHKAFIPIVTQGVYGGEEIVKYLESVGDFWGFMVCHGVCVTTPPEARLPKEEAKVDKLLKEGAKRFYQTLTGEKSPTPSMKKLMIFRFMQVFKHYGPVDCDYRYFKEKGWLEAPYFYETKLSLLKRVFSKFIEWNSHRLGKKMQAERSKVSPSLQGANNVK